MARRKNASRSSKPRSARKYSRPSASLITSTSRLTGRVSAVASSTYTIIRRQNFGSIAGDGIGSYQSQFGTVGAGGTAYAFTLAQLPSFNEFTNLFDQYRVKKLTMHFIPRNSTDSLDTPTTNAGTGIMRLLTAVDYDDQVIPTTESQLLQYGSAQIALLQSPKSVSWVPRVKSTPSGAAGIVMPPAQWLDCGNPNVLHYGLKTWTDIYYGKYTLCDVIVEAMIEFKLSR